LISLGHFEQTKSQKDVLSRWEKTKLNPQQQQEVTRLKKQVARNKQLTESILALADELKENTIDQILGRDDAQLAIDVLTGKLKPPRNTQTHY
jgi:CHASE3 domain sensor protein